MSPQTFMIGATCVHLVSDGTYWTDGGGAFGLVPRVMWEKVISPDALNRIPMQTRCLLIESSQGLILVDTGYGDKLAAKQREILGIKGDRRLAGDIARLGFRPEDIDLVIDTHLHADHCSGNTAYNENGQVVPAFPNATYMVQRLELADASFPNERTRGTYFAENFVPLGEPGAGVLSVLNGDTQVTPEVRTWNTPGHTRGHQSIVVESQGQAAIFLADAGAWAVHMEKLAWVPAYDLDPMTSIETKRNIRTWAHKHDALLFFQHDPAIGAGRLRGEAEGEQARGGEARWQVEPEEGISDRQRHR